MPDSTDERMPEPNLTGAGDKTMRKLTHQEAIHMPLADIVKYQRDTYTAWKNLTDKLDPMLAELRNDIDNAVKNAVDRLPDAPWKDKTATEAVWLAVADRDTLAARVAEAEAKIAELKHSRLIPVAFDELCDWLLPQLPTERAEIPSREELIPLVGKQLNIAYNEKFSPYSSRGWEYTQAILTALRPWLRTPTGPCKECEKLEAQYQDLISVGNDEADRINKAMEAIEAARAALEGE